MGHQGTERIHLHGIIFTTEPNETIIERWGYGNVWIGKYVNEKTINYIIKYISKIDNDHKEYNSKILCTAGIGKRDNVLPAGKTEKDGETPVNTSDVSK